MAQPQQPNDIERPGVMGDWTEEQNLGQPGDPKARITEQEVKEAFSQKKPEDEGQDGSKPQ